MADDATPKAPPAKKSLPSELIMSARCSAEINQCVRPPQRSARVLGVFARGVSGYSPERLISAQARWDTLLERVVLNSGAGALIGLAASLVLSRGRTARWAITFFGAGTGVGMAVERSSSEMSAAEREK